MGISSQNNRAEGGDRIALSDNRETFARSGSLEETGELFAGLGGRYVAHVQERTTDGAGCQEVTERMWSEYKARPYLLVLGIV